MSSNLSKYSNSKYKSKYLKYKNKYLLEKYEQDNIFDLKQQESNKNILNTIEKSNGIDNTTDESTNKKINFNNKTLKTMSNKINLNNVSIESDNNLNKSNIQNLSYNLNLSNLEISENGYKDNISNNSILETDNKINSNKYNVPKLSYKLNLSNLEILENGKNKKISKKTSKSASKKTSKSASKKINSLETQIKNKILDNKINWNEISKKDVKKINFGKNKITIGFIGGSKLELGFTSTLDETTWFEKFIKINIIDKEPHYDPIDTCNIKITKLFTSPSGGYKKFIEYENLVGKKIKLIKWIGDSWMYPSNKQECDHNHVFKIQTTGSEYYLFVLRCSSSGGIDADLTINYKK
jgi:hypothetical protein